MKITAQSSIKYQVLSIKQKIKKSIIHNTYYILPSASGGFTLIEVLVAATILATLAGGVLLALNPFAQIERGQDAQRMADLQALRTALDLYYNDNECYPMEIPFGNEWRVGNTVYMKETPQDPQCDEDGNCYRYRTDTSSACPQWNVVFAELSRNSTITDACALSSLSNCTPEGYEEGRFACVLSGGVDCTALLATSLQGGIETVGNTPTPTPVPSATPTPTPPPPDGSQTYAISNPTGTNPDIWQATVMTLCPQIGEGQAIRVNVDDAVGNVTSVSVLLISDGDGRNFTLTRTGGTPAAGTWEAAWQVTDTYRDRYGFDITARDDQGNVQTAEIREDYCGRL